MRPLGARNTGTQRLTAFSERGKGKILSSLCSLMMSPQQQKKKKKLPQNHKPPKTVKTPDTFSIIHSKYDIYVYIIIPLFFLQFCLNNVSFIYCYIAYTPFPPPVYFVPKAVEFVSGISTLFN